MANEFLLETKCQTGGKQAKDVSIGADRISNLPDNVIQYILSFLPTKFAVLTGSLSKRWKYLWTSVPCLVFDDSLLLKEEEDDEDDEDDDYIGPENCLMDEDDIDIGLDKCFMNFADTVLDANKMSKVRKFSLHCRFPYDVGRINDWISNSIGRNVQEIDFSFHPDQDVELPPSFFTNTQVEILELGVGILFNILALVSFPRLKILTLVVAPYFDDNSMKKFLDGCPFVEDLTIFSSPDTETENLTTFYIQSSSLKKLQLWTVNCQLIVEAPNLKILDIRDYVTAEYTLNCLSSLVTVYLNLWPDDSESELSDIYISRVIELLKKISHVEFLWLSFESMNSLKCATLVLENRPIFHNLINLEVEIEQESWDVLLYFLECSPHLLTLSFGRILSHAPLEWGLKFLVPKCLKLRLEEVKFTGFEGCPDEIEMVRYFLKNATVLKKMSIESCESCPKNELEILKKLLLFPRSSPVCEIEFK